MCDYDHRFSKHYALSLGINGRAMSGTSNVEYKNYYDVAEGTIRVDYPAYTMWKLSATHNIGKAIKLTTALDNLFNYRPKYYYLNCPLTDGINFQVGVSIDIDKF